MLDETTDRKRHLGRLHGYVKMTYLHLSDLCRESVVRVVGLQRLHEHRCLDLYLGPLDPIASIDHRELEVGRLVSGRWCFIFSNWMFNI